MTSTVVNTSVLPFSWKTACAVAPCSNAVLWLGFRENREIVLAQYVQTIGTVIKWLGQQMFEELRLGVRADSSITRAMDYFLASDRDIQFSSCSKAKEMHKRDTGL